MHQRTVFAPAQGLATGSAGANCFGQQMPVFVAPICGNNQIGERQPDSFEGGKSKRRFRAFAPKGNVP
jgi:hypothetical protein